MAGNRDPLRVDNVCHSLLGAALGRAGLARRTPLGMTTLVVANNLPDVDVAVFASGVRQIVAGSD